MLIVGGKNSSNTTKLLRNRSSGYSRAAYHIETEDEIRPEWFTGLT